MRVVLLGNNTMAVECLEYMAKQEVEIVAVVPENSDDGKDGWQRSLKKSAENLGIRVIKPTKLTDQGFLDEVREMNPDFIFSVQCRRILRKELIDIPVNGVVNLHLSLLPRYRGCYPVSWALMNGEERVGATLHYIDEGIDTGDIIAQKEMRLEGTETAREVFDCLTDLGYELFRERFGDIISLNADRTPQDDSRGLYYPMGSIDFSRKAVDWNSDCRELNNWIRAFIFPPFQYPEFSLKGEAVGIASVGRPGSRAHGYPGEVIGSGDSLEVSCPGGSVVIRSVFYRGREMPASEFTSEAGISKGTSLA